MEWRVPRKVTIVKFAAAAVFVVAAVLLAGDPTRLALALLAAAGLLAYAVRDLLAPVRLAANEDGVTIVRGYAGRLTIPWADIERIRVDDRRRLVGRSTMLEIDTGQSLYFLSGYELGVPPNEVADAVLGLRTGR